MGPKNWLTSYQKRKDLGIFYGYRKKVELTDLSTYAKKKILTVNLWKDFRNSKNWP